MYMATIMQDGNFSAEHLKPRRADDDVPLNEGSGFMVTDGPYKAHLAEALETKQVSSCNCRHL